MDVVVTSAEMQGCDRHAMVHDGVPSALLMENAGREVAETAAAEILRAGGDRVTIVCGPGNNGGDGFVAARHLLDRGLRVRVVLIGRPSRLKGDPLTNYAILKNLARETSLQRRLVVVSDPSARKMGDRHDPQVVIDSIFGTGFHGALSGPYLRAVEWINRRRGVRLAVDIPSGLDADNGRIGNTCVRADVTVTMGRLKVGLLTGSGPAVCGKVVVGRLGVPLGSRVAADTGTWRITADDVAEVLPGRPFNAHKHSVGKVLVIAGSPGFTGAAALCADSAMRAGAGAVVLATPETVYPVLSRKLTEVMVKPLKAASEGTLSGDALESLQAELTWADVIIAGPGLGKGAGVARFVKKLLKLGGKRFILDADVLNHLADDRSLEGILRRNNCILTPHTGEFSRLTGIAARDIENNRVELSRIFSKKNRITLVLKGAPTVTAAPEGAVFINSSGNPGMATAGMGDVLAGMIGGLWAGMDGDGVPAAWAGAYLHGYAGDLAAARMGPRSLMAGDVLKEIPKVFVDKHITRSS